MGCLQWTTAPNPTGCTFIRSTYDNAGRPAGDAGADIAVGPARLGVVWPELAVLQQPRLTSLTCFKMGHIKHHGVESGGQVGALINMVWNRDPMCHSHTNYISRAADGPE